MLVSGSAILSSSAPLLGSGGVVGSVRLDAKVDADGERRKGAMRRDCLGLVWFGLVGRFLVHQLSGWGVGWSWWGGSI